VDFINHAQPFNVGDVLTATDGSMAIVCSWAPHRSVHVTYGPRRYSLTIAWHEALRALVRTRWVNADPLSTDAFSWLTLERMADV
jgi:hypothetical protein